MADQVESLIAQLRNEGGQKFAAWNASVFDAYLAESLGNLQLHLSWEEKKESSVDLDTRLNFVRLVYEAVGAGWLTSADPDAPPTTFLAHCISLLSYRISNIPRADRGRIMQLIWNLGEGMAQQPQWLNQYAIARTDWSTKLAQLDQHLETILAPVLTPLPAADWQSQFRVSVLDFRRESESFLPGRVYLAAPALLCVEDRLNEMETQAVLLAKDGESILLGSVGKLDEYQESFSQPLIKTDVDFITVNGHKVDTPFLHTPMTPVCVAAGFIAIAATDSQRIWLVEAA